VFSDLEQNMNKSGDGCRRHSEAEERRNREAALDKTIEASFPASDPPSSDPNPDVHDDTDDDQRSGDDENAGG